MEQINRLVVPLRVLLATIFFLLVLGQVFSFPGMFAHMAKENPEDAELRWPLTIVAILMLLCVQVVIVCTWRLLTMVKEDSIFSDDAFVWVDTIIGAIGAGWLIFCGLTLFAISQADDPGAPALLIVITMVGAVLGLLMVVMRVLLRRATTLRSDMDTVI